MDIFWRKHGAIIYKQHIFDWMSNTIFNNYKKTTTSNLMN
jgi:hypothetical protein